MKPVASGLEGVISACCGKSALSSRGMNDEPCKTWGTWFCSCDVGENNVSLLGSKFPFSEISFRLPSATVQLLASDFPTAIPSTLCIEATNVCSKELALLASAVRDCEVEELDVPCGDDTMVLWTLLVSQELEDDDDLCSPLERPSAGKIRSIIEPAISREVLAAGLAREAATLCETWYTDLSAPGSPLSPLELEMVSVPI